ncbi:ABC transporter permease [Streptomyces sp. TRM 70361]|uniref:ABC transporter permease n=1 Tax=Streptomyces sp. TRM 70361 TaxID=3116553 RepID=UPI002E7AB21E|nr:ABC transporter permease [Streptomyces sp. TRM 70361]MEE1941606.1 ABC transporter permease [Streptomyces sp. TRM 70361]
MSTRTTGAGTYAPRPGAAPLPRMIAAQAALETRLLLRHGEQLLLTIVIPTLLLVLFSAVDIIDLADGGDGGGRVDFLAPGVLALAVLSTAFTGQAISTGFERRYGVLKRLGASPLPRWGLMTAKTCAVLVVEVLQVALLTSAALALGWSPRGGPLAVALLLVAGTAAFSGLGLLMAGTLRAEATLAAANLVFVLLLVGGGVVVPLDRFPAPVRGVLEWLPISALSEGLREVLRDGAGLPWAQLAVLGGWAVVGLAAAARFFRWE